MALRRRSTRLHLLMTAAAISAMTAAAVVTFAATSGMLSRSVSPLSSLSGSEADADDNPRPTKRARIARAAENKDAEDEEGPHKKKKTARKKKQIKQITEPTPGDFPARMTNRWKIGPHVSSAGGVENAIVNAASVGYVTPQF